jgi:phosphate starvation-inducible PhoH-like protein
MAETVKEFIIEDYREATELLERDSHFLDLAGEAFQCEISGRGNLIRIAGDETGVEQCMKCIGELRHMISQNIQLAPRQVKMAITAVKENRLEELREMQDDVINVTKNGKIIHPRTLGQKTYVDAIRKNSITFGIGPAGTGKTYLAVALAAYYLRNHDVQRIILVRPAVEAGEKLGFLPGDMQEKVNPYLRPLFDGLLDMFGPDEFAKLQQKGIIEVAPLAYMRGRTLEKSFIILDEAQNTTVEQIKMFLTRLGFRSKMVVNGDVTQIDLPPHVKSGLLDAQRVLRNIPDIATVRFSEEDVVRHDLVAAIIRAYEEDAKRREERKEEKHGHHHKL